MKKIIPVLMVIIISVIGIAPISAETITLEVEKAPKIKIDENTFPCEMVRQAVKEQADYNNDGWLSELEINDREGISIDTHYYKDEAMGDAVCYDKKYGCVDCKGLDIFKNLEKVWIRVQQVRGYNLIGKSKYGNKIKNLDVLKQLPKLKTLRMDWLNRRNYDFSGFEALKELKLIECGYIKNIKFGKKSKIEKIDLSSSSSNKKIDVSSLKKLKRFKSEFTQLKGVTFGKKNKKIETIIIKGETYPSNKKIKSLDVSKVKNLKRLEIVDLSALKSVKLGKKSKMKKITIFACEKLKKIDVKKCNFPKRAKINISYK